VEGKILIPEQNLAGCLIATGGTQVREKEKKGVVT